MKKALQEGTRTVRDRLVGLGGPGLGSCLAGAACTPGAPLGDLRFCCFGFAAGSFPASAAGNDRWVALPAALFNGTVLAFNCC